MKFNLLFTFLICFGHTLLAQSETTVFLGTVTVEGAKAYPYKLQFKDSGNIIKGYSVTDLRGPDETQTSVWGTINPSKKEITYRETALIKTKSNFDKDSFCFIHTKLRVSHKKGVQLLKGNFTGYKKDGRTKCGKGEVSLLATDDLLKKLLKYVDTSKTPIPGLTGPKDTPITAKNEPVRKTPPAEPDNYKPGEILYVNAGRTLDILTFTGEAVVEVWDHEKIDGDIITIALNDKPVLERHSLTGTSERFTLRLSGKGTTDKLTLIANNEGAEPPATFRMKVTTADRVYTIQASTTLGEGVTLLLKNR